MNPHGKGKEKWSPPSPNTRLSHCTCKGKWHCLHLNCSCFSSGVYCDTCECLNCENNLKHETARRDVVESILERKGAKAFGKRPLGPEEEEKILQKKRKKMEEGSKVKNANAAAIAAVFNSFTSNKTAVTPISSSPHMSYAGEDANLVTDADIKKLVADLVIAYEEGKTRGLSLEETEGVLLSTFLQHLKAIATALQQHKAVGNTEEIPKSISIVNKPVLASSSAKPQDGNGKEAEEEAAKEEEDGKGKQPEEEEDEGGNKP